MYTLSVSLICLNNDGCPRSQLDSLKEPCGYYDDNQQGYNASHLWYLREGMGWLERDRWSLDHCQSNVGTGSVCLCCLPDNLFVCLTDSSLHPCLSVYRLPLPLSLLDELPPYLSVCPNVCQSVSLPVCLLPAYQVVLGCKGSFRLNLLCFQLPIR